MPSRTKLVVAYLGTGFSGWQRQREARTVQGELENALHRLTGAHGIAIVGAGRTDAGVHAAAQVAHADLPAPIPPEVLPRLLNAHLGWDLRVRSARPVSDGFHARRSARGKHYCYRMTWRPPDLPWRSLRSATVAEVTRKRAFESACRALCGDHDWSSFTVPEVARRGARRTVFGIEPVWRHDGVSVHVWGEGFLRYQVRRMIGALCSVGNGRMTTGDIHCLLDHPSPGAALPTAPADGLCLERVYYRASPRLAPVSS
jgi:tRNA pseudouridine38-40 synthase